MHICQQIDHSPQPSFSKCQPCLFHYPTLSPPPLPTPLTAAVVLYSWSTKGPIFPLALCLDVTLWLPAARPQWLFLGTIHPNSSGMGFSVYFLEPRLLVFIYLGLCCKVDVPSKQSLLSSGQICCCSVQDFPQSVHSLSEIYSTIFHQCQWWTEPGE